MSAECPDCGWMHDQAECQRTSAMCDCCAAIYREDVR